jgi:2-dehydro-3-deoxyglucarate aldolase/4-hydroxy-2-oxoheptanedioate aldolase
MPYLTTANEETIVMTAVETREAVENLDDILQVEGLDGIFIGPVDLASSLGYLGDPSQPEVQEMIGLIEQKVLASDKFLGTLAANWDKARACFDKGYRWMVVMQDGATLVRTSNEMVTRFRDDFGDG